MTCVYKMRLAPPHRGKANLKFSILQALALLLRNPNYFLDRGVFYLKLNRDAPSQFELDYTCG